MYRYTSFIHADPSFQHQNNAQKMFLAWQSKWCIIMSYVWEGPRVGLWISLADKIWVNCQYNHNSVSILFIAFDLLRIDIHGFNMFCRYILEKHLGYFISPLRVSGSAVETLFSQFKYTMQEANLMLPTTHIAELSV